MNAIQEMIAAALADTVTPPDVVVVPHPSEETRIEDINRRKRFAAEVAKNLCHLSTGEDGRQYRLAKMEFEEHLL